jgi:hypothetical protein
LKRFRDNQVNICIFDWLFNPAKPGIFGHSFRCGETYTGSIAMKTSALFSLLCQEERSQMVRCEVTRCLQMERQGVSFATDSMFCVVHVEAQNGLWLRLFIGD